MFSQWSKLVASRRLPGYRPQVLPEKFDNVIVAMSSGVDSSVAAAIFADQYPNVRGIYMQNWSKSQSLSDPSKEPCYERDWKDVLKTAEHLGIPVDKVNFEKDYWIDVFEPMLESYNRGWTPNPDVLCNKFVKFGKLRHHLNAKYGKGNYWLVTGHYARALDYEWDNETHLLRSYYLQKDQSYYLSLIPPLFLPRVLFPIGHLTKPEVRQLAKEFGLPSATKPDSQGICFVNNSQHGKFKNFLQHYLPDSKGHIVTIDETTGNKQTWGQHNGLWSYTSGQKIGLSMPQGDPKYAGTWYVSDKLQDTNELVIVKGSNHPALYKKSLDVQNFTIQGIKQATIRSEIAIAAMNGTLTMQYRSLQEPISVLATELPDNKLLHVELVEKQRAMAPGQNCCLYVGDRIVGSGTIAKVD
ncbi:hypothetical protein HG537_0D03200 [Torulaspora globosa]|uniref:tRNA-5-taurinomethyluridine 2-sulfurtransferase n=1 Tax=Torulaspora globosa TaxID=48254 RepID=A0A7H9HSN5_9SACH|nr:hypothetical protein HG537_0D03200 [Torulaspora sp. CBS 2947]